jgi:hypothetical protein
VTVSVTQPSNHVVRGEREIATIAIRRVSTVTLGIYAAYEIFAAFTSANPIHYWQYAFAAVTAVLYLGGFIHISKKNSPLSYAPMLGFFIFVPLIVDHSAQYPWISNGLTCIIAAVYMTGTGDARISYISAIFIAFVQYAIARAHFASTSDLSDIQYFGSYFSTLWVVAVAIAMVNMRVRYLNMCDQMDEELDALRMKMFYRRQYLKGMNLKDFLNLQLHGTVLNSLIVLRNRAEEEGVQPKELESTIIADLDLLSGPSEVQTLDLEELLHKEFIPRIDARVNVTIGAIDPLPENISLNIQLLELFREIILNADRHANAKNASISLVRGADSRFELKVVEDSIAEMTPSKRPQAAAAAMNSLSVARLIKPIAGTCLVEVDPQTKKLAHTVSFDGNVASSDPIVELARLRYASIDVLSRSFLQLSFAYGALILPGLFITGEATTARLLFALSTVASGWALYSPRYRELGRWIATLSALSILPLLEFHPVACASIPALAWMFNGMLGSVFQVSSKSSSPLLRWLPGLIFLAESILTAVNFPKACNSILAGSTPGIIFILLASLLAGRLRNQNLKADSKLSRATETEETNVEATEKLVTNARQQLVNELREFAHSFSLKPIQKHHQAQAISLQIQRTRAFLLCSEYFEYDPARELYRWVLDRADRGHQTKVNILGEGKFEVSSGEWKDALSRTNQIAKTVELTVNVLNTDHVEITVYDSETNREILRKAFASSK